MSAANVLTMPPVFWAKYVPENAEEIGESSQWLPLSAHCIDVAMVFRALCDLPAINRTLQLTATSPLDPNQLDRLAFLAGIHDVGKANWGFQCKVLNPSALKAGHVRELAALLDPECSDDDLRDKFLAALPTDMAWWFDDDEIAYSYLMAAFSHHGNPLLFQGETTGAFRLARDVWWQPRKGKDPFEAVASVVEWLLAAFPGASQPGCPLPAIAAFHHRFAGLITLADWLGSHQAWFPVGLVTLHDRLEHNQGVIPVLLQSVGLDVTALRPVLAAGPSNFEGRFGFGPRPVQEIVHGLDPDDDHTRLCVIESETGSGKTEAVLDWFFTGFAAGKVDSLYFALPTRAAAYELHQRVVDIMERWFPDPLRRPAVVLAVPRYPDPQNLESQSVLPVPSGTTIWDEDVLRHGDDVRLWAAERPKRFLAATIAVGTVDQALLSIVQTKHAHLRSVCLDRSLLVVDEVHASDVYMSRLLEDLLRHHFSVGGMAALLSATLGARARARFLSMQRAEEIPSLPEAVNVPYPLVSLYGGSSVSPAAMSKVKEVTFDLRPILFHPDHLGDEIAWALQSGARVLAVFNTVGRAIDFFRACEAHPGIGPERLFHCKEVASLHHSRFSPADRIALDRGVSRTFGRTSESRSVLLIGTQTLEQSLDLDADLLVTDLCPADVLLQRIGRLHRHTKTRPVGYENPRCIVLTPEGDLAESLDERGMVRPSFRRAGIGSVYEDVRMLELTRRLIAERRFTLPRDNRRLVEGATHPAALATLDGIDWQRHGQLVEGQSLAKVLAAGTTVATYDQYFGQFQFNEAGGKISTRLGADTMTAPVIPSFRGPFGQTVNEIVIPGHMRPKESCDTASASLKNPGEWILNCGERRYRYSRVGLEVAE